MLPISWCFYLLAYLLELMKVPDPISWFALIFARRLFPESQNQTATRTVISLAR